MFSFEIDSLEGKVFELGKQDCFTLVRDFYRLNFDIEIPDFARPNDWDSAKDDMIGRLYAKAGFDKLDVDENWPPRPADLLVATARGTVPNHLIVYLGGNQILHHHENQLSRHETLRPAWKRYTSYILRHPQVVDLTEEKPTLTLKEVYDENLV